MYELEMGDLLFVRPKDWKGRFIQRLSKGIYSHVGIYAGDQLVIDAESQRKVGYRPLSDFKGRYDVFRSKKKLSNEQKEAILAYLHAQMGSHYDYIDLIILFFKLVFQFKLPLPESSKRMICTELACKAYRNAHVYLPTGLLTPSELSKCPQLVKVNATEKKK